MMKKLPVIFFGMVSVSCARSTIKWLGITPKTVFKCFFRLFFGGANRNVGRGLFW